MKSPMKDKLWLYAADRWSVWCPRCAPMAVLEGARENRRQERDGEYVDHERTPSLVEYDEMIRRHGGKNDTNRVLADWHILQCCNCKAVINNRHAPDKDMKDHSWLWIIRGYDDTQESLKDLSEYGCYYSDKAKEIITSIENLEVNTNGPSFIVKRRAK